MDHTIHSINHNYIHINATQAEQSLMSFIGFRGEKDKIKASNEKTSQVVIPLTDLAHSPEFVEDWSDGELVKIDVVDGQTEFVMAQTAQHLMLNFQCSDSPLMELVGDVYKTAYRVAQQKGFDHLIRVWNYLDQINGEEAGMERYQTFCVARHEVLDELSQLDQPNPAATAIGGYYGHNTFTFLFSRQKGKVIENTRQVSAWQYPSRYSPKQPRFSRAMQYGDLLLCSGTASVVGHETIHLNDLNAQFDECMVNIQALLDASDILTPLSQGIYRFYLRDKALLPCVLEKIKALKIEQFLLLEGDICRKNLLIECEAVFQSV